ncbi:hypothetical protein D3C71_1035230 [compost metagenome]
MIELREHDVPYFQEAFILPARVAFRIRQISISFPAIVKDFRTRSTRSFADIPEVIFQLHNSLRRQTQLLVPQLVRFFILRIYRYGQTLRIEADPFFAGQEFPCPGYCLFFKIISD